MAIELSKFEVKFFTCNIMARKAVILVSNPRLRFTRAGEDTLKE
jgi:hypothetical protein